MATLLTLAACTTGDPPPGPPPGWSHTLQRLTAARPLAAARATVAYDPSTVRFSGLADVAEGAMAAAHDDGAGAVTVSWFSPAPDEGLLLTLHWTAKEGSPVPTLLAAEGYDAAAGALPDAVAVSAYSPAGAAQPEPVVLKAGPVAAGQALTTACRAADYPVELAAEPLGDVDGDGSVGLRDVVVAHAALAGSQADDARSLFHLDLTGECRFDERDIEAAFLKAALPDLEARVVAKPVRLTYAQLRAGAPVVVANAGRQPLTGLTFAGMNLNGSAFHGTWAWVVEGQSAVWELGSDPNDALGALEVRAAGSETSVAVGNVAVLVAGQSNAVGWDPDVPTDLRDGSAFPDVRMLGNDYRWKPATEPLDSATGQLDVVSADQSAGTSAGTALGRLLNAGSEAAGVAATGRAAYLVPAALGGSRMTPRDTGGTLVGWYLGPDDLAGTDRATLYGSAAYRALVSAGERTNPTGEAPEGGPVSAVFWYQGESDNSTASLRRDYSAYTEAVLAALRSHLTAASAAVDPVVIYAQLAAYGCCQPGETADDAYAEHLRSHDVAERQRRLEVGAYSATAALLPSTGLSSGAPGAHMVVTHDLPRFDRVHLSAAGQLELARRVALAYQEHVLGWDVDGTGPRLVSLSRSGNVVTVTLDRDVEQTPSPGPGGYSGYYAAWDGPPSPGGDYSPDYGTSNQLAVTDVRRDPNDARRVIVTLATTPSGPVYLRYMRPHEPAQASQFLQDVVRAAGSGLPLPSFGPLRVN